MSEDFGDAMIERMVRVETRLDEVLKIAHEDRDIRQQVTSIMEALSSFDKRISATDTSVIKLYNQSDPLIHATPPVMTQLYEHRNDLNNLAAIAKENRKAVAGMQDSIKWLARTVGGSLILGFFAAFLQFGPS